MKKKLTVLIIALAIAGALFLYFQHRSISLAPERIPIPNTELTIRIPENYQIRYDENLNLLAIEIPYTQYRYPRFDFFPFGFEVSSNTSSEKMHEEYVQKKFGSDDGIEAKEHTVGEVKFYIGTNVDLLSGVPGMIHALVIHKDQGILINAVSSPDNVDEARIMLENILFSLQENKK